MLIPDVNVFVHANQSDSPRHAQLRPWLAERLRGVEPIGVSTGVLASFIRIATNTRLWGEPASPDEALRFCDAVMASKAATLVAPGARHWAIFADLIRETRARANTVPDAYLAALALESGATFVTSDRGFARFPGLRLLDPLAE